jgi:hypothetical protein
MDISQDLTTGIITFSNKFDVNTITTIPLVLPSQDGGFESSQISGTAGFQANGWTVVNDTTSQWFVGVTGATGQSQFGAYISSNGGLSATYGKTSSVSWFYRDINLPPYSKKIDLTFDLKVGGDSFYDKVRVFNLPSDYNLLPGKFISGHLEEFSNVDWKKLKLSSNLNFSTATQSRKIAFGWNNNKGVQLGDSAKIDNIEISVDCAYQDLNSPPIFTSPGQEFVLSFPEQQFVRNLKSFNYDTLGINQERYLIPYYRISRDSLSWTEWATIKTNFADFPKIDPLDPFYLEIKWIRKGTSDIGIIRLIEYKIEGQLEREIQEEDGVTTLVQKGKSIVIKPPFIYKVFKIFDTEIISSTGIPQNCKVSYRYSQDNSKSWSKWEPFDKQHITTIRINPIRFFQIEYLIENNSQIPVSIQDINLIGDFQNVTEDYKKTNLFGIRQCCQSNIMGTYDQNGVFIPNTTLNQNGGQGGPGCDPNISSLPQMTTDEKAGLYNPYQQSQAMNLLQKLSNDSQMIFGHRVIYFATDPDKKGTDHIINEYQLYNVVCEGELKISVDGNQFPDSQIVMNQFDLNLFETFQVHVTKQQFKELFGPQRRPAKEDFLYFCDLNRMYSVDHAQQFRNFNNAAVYYKLVLKKYNKTANIDFADNNIKTTVNNLTKNTTIDELFSPEISEQKEAIANKNQNQPLTREPIRLEYLAEISKELVENSSTIISKSHYDLSSVTFGDVAVRYKNLKTVFNSTSNFGFYCWFNLNNYIQDESYNLFHFFDRLNIKGWKVNLINDQINLQMENDVYTWNLKSSPTGDTTALSEETWYCYVINIDQRNSQVSQWIYKRDVEEEEQASTLFFTTLRKVYDNTQSISTISFEVDGFAPEILASDMKMTNIRLFNDIIPESTHNKILNQYIIGDDSKYLIFADNATTRIYLPKFPLFE